MAAVIYPRSLIALAATVAAEIRGRACGVCGERSRRMGAHVQLDHLDEKDLSA